MMENGQLTNDKVQENLVKNAVAILPISSILHFRVLPLSFDEAIQRLACAGEPDLAWQVELRFLLRKQIVFERWPLLEFEAVINQILTLSKERSGQRFSPGKPVLQKEKATLQGTVSRDVVPYVDDVISRAIDLAASDIHVETDDEEFRIRIRIDGKLVELDHPDCRPQLVISRLKIMAGLDIAEKRRPQDGRIRVDNGARKVDIRVSTLPTDFGEKVVLRILDKSALNLSLDNLQMDAELLLDFRRILKLPHGMILVTGPTGSGKTTTLYAALNYLNNSDTNIITIEDPIEYNLQGVSQTMVRSDIGLSFAAVLRTVLRQDPNIIMLGEIRDQETAEIAVRSALTGHLVLSTLHTNDSASTILRLIDMGVEPFLLASSIRLILAQRLVRRICENCKEMDEMALERYLGYDLPDFVLQAVLYRGVGCEHCHHTGYRGREAVFEPLVMTDELADLIVQRAGVTTLRKALENQSRLTLRDAAMQKVVTGVTTLDEVLAEVI